jgi:hypothetical protein
MDDLKIFTLWTMGDVPACIWVGDKPPALLIDGKGVILPELVAKDSLRAATIEDAAEAFGVNLIDGIRF